MKDEKNRWRRRTKAIGTTALLMDEEAVDNALYAAERELLPLLISYRPETLAAYFADQVRIHLEAELGFIATGRGDGCEDNGGKELHLDFLKLKREQRRKR